jgi:hypothetical protein
MGDGYVKKHMAGMQCSMSMMEKKSMWWSRCEGIGIKTCDNKDLGWLASNSIHGRNDHIGNIINVFLWWRRVGLWDATGSILSLPSFISMPLSSWIYLYLVLFKLWGDF